MFIREGYLNTPNFNYTLHVEQGDATGCGTGCRKYMADYFSDTFFDLQEVWAQDSWMGGEDVKDYKAMMNQTGLCLTEIGLQNGALNISAVRRE